MPDCPSCHRPLPPSGLCGQCLLARMAEVECAPVRRLGDYELLEELDHGGMGVVWRARHRELGRVVALKVIRGGAAAGESEIVRFRTEAEAVARLDHPGIVPVFELGEVDGVPFFTMPLLTGGSLQRRLEQAERMPPREAAALMVQVARAVAHAHERGVLHRDLKPANVLLDESGVPRVADFGLARFLESDSALTMTGATLGTPAYAAPEQLRGDAPTTAGDVFSLGGILYHLLGGRPPRDARDPLTALQTAAREDPGPLCLPGGSALRDLQIITMRCLQRDPARRYGGAAALAEDLERWLWGEPILARAASLPERVWKWMRRRPALAALIAVGALSLAAVFVQQVISERRVRAESEAARRAEAAAVRAAAELEENLYAADMSLGMRAAAERNQSLIRRILARHAGRGVAQSRRGFEFAWLSAIAEKDAAVILRGHTGPVHALAVTPDGSLLASAGADGFLRLWRLPGGEPAGIIPAKVTRDDDPAFLADKLAAASRLARFPGVLKQVLNDPEQITILTSRATAGYLGSINTLSFSHDGTLLAAGGSSALTKVWSVSQGNLLQVFPLIHSQAIFHPRDDRLFITSGLDLEYRSGTGSVSVWNGRTGDPVPGDFGSASLPGVFTHGGDVISFPDDDRGIRALNAADGKLLFHNQNNIGHHILTLAAAPDFSMGATTDTRGPEVLVAHSDSRHLIPLACGSTIPRCLTWSPDSSLLAAGCPDHRVRLWSRDLREQPPLLGHDGEVRAVLFTPDGGMLCSASADGTVRLWNMHRQPEPVPYTDLDARLLARDDMLLSCANDSAMLWRNGTRIFSTSHDPRSHDWPLGWSADGSQAAVFRYTGRDAGTLLSGEGELLWHSTQDGSLQSTVPLGHQRFFRAAALSPDGSVLVTATTAPATGMNLLRRDAHSGAVTATCHVDIVNASVLAFTSDGTRLAASDGASHLAVLDAETFRILWERKQGAPSLLRVPGALAVAAAEQIHLLHPDTGAELAVMSGHAGRVLHLALHPDGRTLASASADRTIRLWHLPTRQEIGTLHSGMSSPASSLGFTADGTRLIAGQRAGPALVFDAPKPKPKPAPSTGNPPVK